MSGTGILQRGKQEHRSHLSGPWSAASYGSALRQCFCLPTVRRWAAALEPPTRWHALLCVATSNHQWLIVLACCMLANSAVHLAALCWAALVNAQLANTESNDHVAKIALRMQFHAPRMQHKCTSCEAQETMVTQRIASRAPSRVVVFNKHRWFEAWSGAPARASALTRT